jgi:HlyD family secretion protein
VRRVASQAEFTPRDVQTREDRDRLVYAVEIAVENPDGALRAGMPGDVSLPGTRR